MEMPLPTDDGMVDKHSAEQQVSHNPQAHIMGTSLTNGGGITEQAASEQQVLHNQQACLA